LCSAWYTTHSQLYPGLVSQSLVVINIHKNKVYFISFKHILFICCSPRGIFPPKCADWGRWSYLIFVYYNMLCSYATFETIKA